ncbi:MAG: methyltransferase [Actinomycetota bacterium]|nr:methyltransferase [Actinomycetota bacterium]
MRFGPIEVTFDGAVLRPRPWTLAQSEWAAELADGTAMLEVGAGAGHIGLAAVALTGAPLVQVDRDPAACRWAGFNTVGNGLSHLVEQRCGTAGEVLGEHERFTVVIADPPYVPSVDVSLYPEDPLGAIDGGADGLAMVRSFLVDVEDHVPPGGSVILQVRGPAQVELLTGWLAHPSAPQLALSEARSYGDLRALIRLDRWTWA